jgi:exopolysaccharide biosynthesis polyprenyl glycosylphosphotransferase
MTAKFYLLTPERVKYFLPIRIPVLLLMTDIAGITISVALSLSWRLSKNLNISNPTLYIFLFLTLIVLYLADTYNSESQIAGLRAPARVLVSIPIIAALSGVLVYLFSIWQYDSIIWRSVLFPSLVLFTPGAVISRLIAAKFTRSRAEQASFLILGEGDSIAKFAADFQDKNPHGKLVLLSDNSKLTNSSETLVKPVGTVEDLSKWLSQPWSGVLLAAEVNLSDALMQQLMEIRLKGIPVYWLPDFYETSLFKLPSSLLEDTWFVFSAGFNLVNSRINLKLKRFIDILTSSLLLLCLSPLMLVTCILIKLDSPGPIFYSQFRSGLNGRPFKVYKFRSMYQDAEKRGAQWAKERDPRITRVGNFIRLTRVDELPQIWNVFRGEMSLIGPRPERPEFDVKLKEAIPYYEVRYLVKPGITGWAQVMYPYGASVEDSYQKLAYDIYYIKNYSLWLDLAIFFKTIRIVLLGKGR